MRFITISFRWLDFMSNLNRNKDSRKKALGRGLGALIPRQGLDSSAGAAPQSDSPDYFICKIKRIKPCATQPRKHFDQDALNDLAASIKESGLIQPLVVRRIEGDDKNYELIAGERRWRASQLAGLTEVPVVLKEVSDAIAFALALIENIQRQDLNPVEEALAYRRLIEEFNFKQSELAEQVGKSRAAVSNAMRLLQLPEDVLELLGDGSLSAGHARALLSLEADDASVLAEMIIDQELTVRDVEQRARSIKHGTHKISDDQAEVVPTAEHADTATSPEEVVEVAFQAEVNPPVSVDAPVEEVSEEAGHPVSQTLREDDTTRSIVKHVGASLGARVQLRDQHGKGHIEIHYEDYEALKRLLAALDLDVEL